MSNSRRLAQSEVNAMEARRVDFRCPWTGCENTMRVYRSQIAWSVDRSRGRVAIFCPSHRATVKELLGPTARMNGFGRIFATPDRIYATRNAQPLALRVVVFERFRRGCAQCGERLVFAEQGKAWQIDHVVPVFRGGLTTMSNLAPLCSRCHKEKSREEIREVRRIMPNVSRRFWETHAEKDRQIAALRKEITGLRQQSQLARWGNGNAPTA